MTEQKHHCEHPFHVRQGRDGPVLDLSLSEYLMWCYKTPHEPHWAVALLLDPRAGDLEELADSLLPPEPPLSLEQLFERGFSWLEATRIERALGSFDIAQPGWVPTWFPRTQDQGDDWLRRDRELAPEERLAWFDEALEWYSRPGEWPPTGSPVEKQQAIALALTRLCSAVDSGELDEPTAASTENHEEPAESKQPPFGSAEKPLPSQPGSTRPSLDEAFQQVMKNLKQAAEEAKNEDPNLR